MLVKNIGIDVGGTNCRIGVFQNLSLLEEIRFQADFSKICKIYAPKASQKIILDTISEAILNALKKHPEVQNIGIGFPGFIDPKTRCIIQSPNLPGLNNTNLAEDLTKYILKKVKINPIVIENDALAAAYGEFKLLNKAQKNLIYIGLGTGVGGGLIYAEKPFAGEHGVAMEIGHIIVNPQGRMCGCGNNGCMEQYASTNGVSLSYLNATNLHYNAHEISILAKNGDENALDAYALAGESLAIAIAHIVKIIDISNIVIGGGLSQSWDLMKFAFDTKLNADLIPILRKKTNIIISSNNDKAGMLGASMLANLQVKSL